jgi:hypothetical protein
MRCVPRRPGCWRWTLAERRTRPLDVRTKLLRQVLRRRIETVQLMEKKYGDNGESGVLTDCLDILEEWLERFAEVPHV